MTITISQFVRNWPFRGNTDPSLPNAIWQGVTEVQGDASGGIMGADTILSQNDGIVGGLFSLEQLGFQMDQDTGLNATMFFANQHNPFDPATSITTTVMLPQANGAGDGRTGAVGKDLGWLPYFIGQAPPTTAQLFIRIQVPNTNGITLRSFIWGYRWDPSAFDTPTGPRRPANGVFPN